MPSKKKSKLYKKSKYYRRRKKQIQILCAMGAGIFLLLLLIVKMTVFSTQTLGAKDVPASGQAGQDPTGDFNLAPSNEEEALLPTDPIALTVTLTGDCTLGTDENFDYDSSLNAYYEDNGSSYFFENVKPLFSQDDLTIVNMEGTLTQSQDREDKLFAFKADASYASILSDGSVEAATLANNHSHDYGEQSFADTKAALDAAGIVHFGYEETAIMEIKGIKVGLVGIYELYDHMERASQVKKNIAKVKAEGAQLVIAVFHWGNEKETVPDSNQTSLGHLAIDEGADLVIGHHPHVVQGVEKYKDKFIAYSLGNFCFGGNSSPSDMDAMIFQQTFTITSEGVEKNDDIQIIPCRISSVYDYNNYQPTLCEGEEYDRILDKIRERSSAIGTTMDSYF